VFCDRGDERLVGSYIMASERRYLIGDLVGQV